MTKAKKPAKGEKETKAKKPEARATVGHNSNGGVIPGVVDIVDELLAINERKKELSKAERDLRNKAKSEYGILSGPLAHELCLRKMDSDVRVQFESAHQDLKVALGYQPELDFQGGVPTKASVAAQPSEEELRRYEVNDEDPAEEEQEATAKDDDLEPPAFLKRDTGKIEREG